MSNLETISKILIKSSIKSLQIFLNQFLKKMDQTMKMILMKNKKKTRKVEMKWKKINKLKKKMITQMTRRTVTQTQKKIPS